jgi:Fe-S oxidoreductase
MGDNHEEANVYDHKVLEKEIIDSIQICRRCRMCVFMCPTYEGWLTQSALGRLAAINLHLKYGLGSEEELSNLLFSCTTCQRCQEKCKVVCAGVNPTEIIIKTRQFLVKRCKAKEEKKL